MNGLVCDFCARAVEKVFGEQEGVTGVDVDLNAGKVVVATEAGFEVGTRTIVDVLQSTRNLYKAKRNLSSTRYNYINSILALKRAAGTISDADITAIQNGLMPVQ